MINAGIDIVEIARAKALYKAYRHKLKRFLTHSEYDYLESKPDKALTLAKMFAIKEAVFKALHAPWFGLEGWRKILLNVKDEQFKVLFLGDLKKFNDPKYRIWINVAACKQFVLANVLIEFLQIKERSLRIKI